MTGCRRYDISICQIMVNRNYLASTYVGTPDPRQECPPEGQLLSISWRIPSEILLQEPELRLHVIYWNYTEEIFTYPVTKRIGGESYFLLDDEYCEKNGILTYKAEIVTEECGVYLEWKHQLWVNLINPEDEEPCLQTNEAESEESASLTSSTVESQSMQGSVIDTAYRRDETSSPSG